MTGDLLGASDIGDHLETLAGLGNALQSEHFNRSGGRRLSNRLALVIEHRPHAAKNLANDKRFMNVQGSLLDQHRRYSAAAAIQLGLQHYARR